MNEISHRSISREFQIVVWICRSRAHVKDQDVQMSFSSSFDQMIRDEQEKSFAHSMLSSSSAVRERKPIRMWVSDG